MLIDFHTHFFPDEIAKASVDKLYQTSGIKYYGDGTKNGLLEFMKKDGVDISLNQPVATKPEQVQSINRKMIELNVTSSPIICFGAMHPNFKGFKNEIAFLKSAGIKGIKLHPEYQQFDPADNNVFGIYEECAANGIIVLFHAGVDLGFKTVHCKPQGMQKVLAIKGLKVVLAHMGAYKMWDEVERYIVGKEVYLDLAYCSEMDNSQLKRIIANHGSDKILFASDFPWERAAKVKEKVESLGLNDKDKNNIYRKNASRLLGLSA
jgi:hypothetical protein